MDTIPTIKVIPLGRDQGDFIVINAKDFNPELHKHFEVRAEQLPRKPRKPAQTQE